MVVLKRKSDGQYYTGRWMGWTPDFTRAKLYKTKATAKQSGGAQITTTPKEFQVSHPGYANQVYARPEWFKARAARAKAVEAEYEFVEVKVELAS